MKLQEAASWRHAYPTVEALPQRYVIAPVIGCDIRDLGTGGFPDLVFRFITPEARAAAASGALRALEPWEDWLDDWL